MYIVDSVHRRVQRYDAGGTFLGAWGESGGRPGDFRSPSGVAANASGVYVADLATHRVDRFTADGDLIPNWGT